MSNIRVERDEMRAILKRPEDIVQELNAALGGFSGTVDGGVASDKLALIVRIALEGAQLAADAANAICAVSREALDDQMLTDGEVTESIDRFSGKEFDN